ncbi:MAG TPA: 50S ribosomal protein L33 [Vampirovibrionales bacterium]
MAKKKTDRIFIKLVDKELGDSGEYFPPSVYWTEKNKRNTTDKLTLVKYNSYKRKHTKHTETK